MDFGRRGSGSFEWNTRIARDLGFEPDKLGFLARLVSSSPAATLELVPLVLGDSSGDDTYEVVVVPGHEFRSLSYELRGLDTTYAVGPIAVRLGFYPAGQPIALLLPPTLPSSRVELKVGGVLTNNAPAALRVILHISSRTRG